MTKTDERTAQPRESAALRFCYHTAAGRILLKLLSARWLSRLCGAVLDSRVSRVLIGPFVRRQGIDLNEYCEQSFPSFNAFFTRQIKPELRPVDPRPEALIAPCDGLLSVYELSGGTVIPVKQSRYSVARLLGGDAIASRYRDGLCLVFRLCVNHYHRYCYVDSGTKGENRFLPGRLHTVRPIALEQYPVFSENCREYTVIETGQFGPVVQMEVGAMLVGRIKNYHSAGAVRRGEEKGMFLYGGSTVIVLLEKGRVQLSGQLLQRDTEETPLPVKLGQCIGIKAD